MILNLSFFEDFAERMRAVGHRYSLTPAYHLGGNYYRFLDHDHPDSALMALGFNANGEFTDYIALFSEREATTKSLVTSFIANMTDAITTRLKSLPPIPYSQLPTSFFTDRRNFVMQPYLIENRKYRIYSTTGVTPVPIFEFTRVPGRDTYKIHQIPQQHYKQFHRKLRFLSLYNPGPLEATTSPVETLPPIIVGAD